MLYNRPDLMQDVNRLSSHDDASYVPALKSINHLIRYLTGCPHHHIMYPADHDGTTTHELSQEVSPGKLHSQSISNGLVAFADYG